MGTTEAKSVAAKAKMASFNFKAQYIDQTVRPQLLDVLWGQPIKLVQMASTSELLENQRNLFSSKSFPLISAGPQKPQKLTASKIKYEKLGPKILIPH